MTNITVSDYNEKQDAWFSPKHVLDNFEVMRKVFRENILNSDFQKARELFAGAVVLLGAYELSPINKYFLQLNKQSSSPDVVAAKQTERDKLPILLELIQIEITELEDHAKTDDIVEFLKTTKLSPRKAYTEKTMIVCVVNKYTPFDHKEISRRLKKLNPKPTIYIIGRQDKADEGDFIIFQAHPLLTKPLQYNVYKTAGKYVLPSPVKLNLGMGKKIEYKNARMEYISIFNMFGLQEEKIERKYYADLKRLIPNPS